MRIARATIINFRFTPQFNGIFALIAIDIICPCNEIVCGIVIKVIDSATGFSSFPGWIVVVIILRLQSIKESITGKVRFGVCIPCKGELEAMRNAGRAKGHYKHCKK
jgi:hypothetical protein